MRLTVLALLLCATAGFLFTAAPAHADDGPSLRDLDRRMDRMERQVERLVTLIRSAHGERGGESKEACGGGGCNKARGACKDGGCDKARGACKDGGCDKARGACKDGGCKGGECDKARGACKDGGCKGGGCDKAKDGGCCGKCQGGACKDGGCDKARGACKDGGCDKARGACKDGGCDKARGACKDGGCGQGEARGELAVRLPVQARTILATPELKLLTAKSTAKPAVRRSMAVSTIATGVRRATGNQATIARYEEMLMKAETDAAVEYFIERIEALKK